MCSVLPKAGPSRKPPSSSPKFSGTNPDFLRLSPHETFDPWLVGYSGACHRGVICIADSDSSGVEAEARQKERRWKGPRGARAAREQGEARERARGAQFARERRGKCAPVASSVTPIREQRRSAKTCATSGTTGATPITRSRQPDRRATIFAPVVECRMRTRAFFLLPLLLAPAFAQDPTVTLKVDATDAPRRLFHVRMNLPAKPGPLTLLYPKWIPGEHMPVGPITNLVGLKVTAAGQPIAWRRDSVNMYAFHLDVPQGATSLDVAFDYISNSDPNLFTSSGSSTTSELAVLNWNQTLLYPEGSNPESMRYQATSKSPLAGAMERPCPLRGNPATRSSFNPRR